MPRLPDVKLGFSKSLTLRLIFPLFNLTISDNWPKKWVKPSDGVVQPQHFDDSTAFLHNWATINARRRKKWFFCLWQRMQCCCNGGISAFLVCPKWVFGKIKQLFYVRKQCLRYNDFFKNTHRTEKRQKTHFLSFGVSISGRRLFCELENNPVYYISQVTFQARMDTSESPNYSRRSPANSKTRRRASPSFKTHNYKRYMPGDALAAAPKPTIIPNCVSQIELSDHPIKPNRQTSNANFPRVYPHSWMKNTRQSLSWSGMTHPIRRRLKGRCEYARWEIDRPLRSRWQRRWLSKRCWPCRRNRAYSEIVLSAHARSLKQSNRSAWNQVNRMQYQGVSDQKKAP